MNEIGGYIEFERYHGPMLHEDGIKLDCGRSCLAYLIRARGIRRIVMPCWMCDSVFSVCEAYGVSLRFYSVGMDLLPEHIQLDKDEWLYLMNYYGQLGEAAIRKYRDAYERVIVDNTQDYFADPVEGVDTIYTCRKYFGVPDGAVLYTDAILQEPVEGSESYEHMRHLLGRFERTAPEFYSDSVANNKRFKDQPIRRMSKLTENLLHSLEYDRICRVRTENFAFLSAALADKNKLWLHGTQGAFAYPFMTEDAASLRKRLVEKKIYVPILWPNVVEHVPQEATEHTLAQNILPLPCDQRYDEQDMQFIVRAIFC